MKYIVDRIEGEYVVCEKDGDIINIPLYELPEVKEGDILVLQDGKYTVDSALKEKRIKEIEEKMNDVWEN